MKVKIVKIKEYDLKHKGLIYRIYLGNNSNFVIKVKSKQFKLIEPIIKHYYTSKENTYIPDNIINKIK